MYCHSQRNYCTTLEDLRSLVYFKPHYNDQSCKKSDEANPIAALRKLLVERGETGGYF